MHLKIKSAYHFSSLSVSTGGSRDKKIRAIINEMKWTYDNTAFNSQIFLLKQPNLNASFLPTNFETHHKKPKIANKEDNFIRKNK